MPRRGENVYKRKDGRWEGRIRRTDGKYHYLYAKTYKEIKEKKAKYQCIIASEMCDTPPGSENPAELFDGWLKSCCSGEVKPSTFENYHSCMKNYVIPFFTHDNGKKLTVTSTERFVNYIKENAMLSDSYKRKILIIFKTALRTILKGTAEYASILQIISLPKAANSEILVFSVKEQRLFENTILMSGEKRDLGMLLCLYTGIRLGELCALKWSDIDIEAGVMSISRTVSRSKNFCEGGNKTTLLTGTPKSQKSNRKIPLPDFLLKLCCEWKSTSADEHCFILSGGETPLDPRSYQKRYKKIMSCAGVKYRKFHAIRHTFATRALELGVDIKTLSEILGHSNVSITLNTYAHSLLEQKKIAIDKFNTLYVSRLDFNLYAVKDSVTAV